MLASWTSSLEQQPTHNFIASSGQLTLSASEDTIARVAKERLSHEAQLLAVLIDEATNPREDAIVNAKVGHYGYV